MLTTMPGFPERRWPPKETAWARQLFWTLSMELAAMPVSENKF